MDRILRVSGDRDARIAGIAERQRNRIGRRQLLAARVGYEAIRRLVRRGRLVPIYDGVYATAPLTRIDWAEESAALLAAGLGTRLGRESAGVLWDLILPHHGDGAHHVIDPSGRTRLITAARGPVPDTRDVRVHRTRILEASDVRVHLGLPVTSPARTLLDLAEILPRRRLELAFDRALVAKIMRLNDVDQLLARLPGRAGTPVLRALAAHHRGSGVTRSEAERRFQALLREARLPPPQSNVRLAGFEVDFFWPAQRLVVEIDGFRFHSTRRAFEHDRRKVSVLRSQRLTVMRFSPRQVQSEPLAVLADVARAL